MPLVHDYIKFLFLSITLIYADHVKINTFEVPHCYHFLLSCQHKISRKAIDYLSGRNILFIGDSISRYQYLSLAYTLRHKQPEAKNAYPSIVQEPSWEMFPTHSNGKDSSWDKFFQGSSDLLHPFENCTRCDHYKQIEHRQYYDPKLNIRLTYIQYKGEIISSTFLYNYFPKDTILDVIITNVGYFCHNQFISNILSNYIEGIMSMAKKVVWRTATYIVKELELGLTYSLDSISNRTTMNWIDNYMCNYKDIQCLDVSWTGKLKHRNNHYWDNIHFYEPIYTVFNDQLFDILVK